MVGNIKDFIQIVGSDNFETFNKWIIDYYNDYPNVEIRKELNENSDTKYTQTIQDGINIIKNMINKKEQDNCNK